jgi:hypothetical protein
MAALPKIFEIEEITIGDDKSKDKDWVYDFRSFTNIKKLINTIYEKHGSKDNYKLGNKGKDIHINNLERLHNEKNKLTLFVCSFTFKDNDDKDHTSIIIGFENRYYLMHNYEVDDNAKEKGLALFVYDNEPDRIDNGVDNPTLRGPIYLFLENDGRFGFNYEFNTGVKNADGETKYEDKYIKFKDGKVTGILDYLSADNPKPFNNYIASNAVLQNSYIKDKYFSRTAVDANNLSVFAIKNDSEYITIRKPKTDIFFYTTNNHKGGDENKKITVRYIHDNKKNINKIVLNYNDDLTILFINNTISLNRKDVQPYSINKKYIPLSDKSTTISALIMLIRRLPDLNDVNGIDLVSDIKSRAGINSYVTDDINNYHNKITSGNFSHIKYDIANTEISIFNVLLPLTLSDDYSIHNKLTGKYKSDDGNEYDVYFQQVILRPPAPAGLVGVPPPPALPAPELVFVNPIFNIDTTKTNTIDLSNITSPDFKYIEIRPFVNLYYYTDNDPNQHNIPANKLQNVKITSTIENINDDNFVVAFDLFGNNGKVKNTNFKVKNLFQVLSFNNKMLIPSQITLFVGKDLASGNYITLQHDNNNWYVYDHKDRLTANYLNDYMFDWSNTYPVVIYYKVINGINADTNDVEKKIQGIMIAEDYDSNDYTIDYYLNPLYELTKFREKYIYDNYGISGNSYDMKSNEYTIKVDEGTSHKVNSSDLITPLKQDKQGTNNEIIHLHTPSFMSDYLNNKFSLNNAVAD